ncbi:MAG: cation:proton antiporter [Planctomycetales bacterium]
MHSTDLILTLTGSLAAAVVLGYLSQRIGLSPIAGYLVAGWVVGPHTPGFVGNQELAEQFAEIGIILMMFGVGLHFHLKDLRAVQRIAVPGAIGQSLVATLLGLAVGVAAGWSWSAGLIFGLSISVASTVVLLRVLSDSGAMHTPAGHIAVGWLVVEDLLTVVVLVLLPALVGPQTAAAASAFRLLGLASLKIVLLVGLIFIVGQRVVPWIIARIAATRSRELFTLTVLALALGIAVGSAQLFGVSAALGAFLAGMVVGRTEFSLRAATEALPMRDAFAVLFFVSTGMLFDPGSLMESPRLAVATGLVIVLAKPLAATLIVLVYRYPLKVALSVGVALAQIGEFSFILAGLGRELEVLPDAATDALVAAALVSITLNPLLYRMIGPCERWLMGNRRLREWLALRTAAVAGEKPAAPIDEGGAHRALVVGYGPVGKALTRLLRENGIAPTVIELNVDSVRQLKQAGYPAVYGDAGHRETLIAAGAVDAGTLVLSASGNGGTAEVIRLARELNPHIRILVRATYVSQMEPLKQAGGTQVISEEAEVALGLIEAILRPLGATGEQLDRERDRFRREVAAAQGKLRRDAECPPIASGVTTCQPRNNVNAASGS